MEDWQLDFEWLRVRHFVKDSLELEMLPDFQAILFLIGVQEYGRIKDDFTKEEKQDLMHWAVCQLLSTDGYYELEGYDDDGWAHFKLSESLPPLSLKDQETLLKKKIIEYFDTL